MIQLEKPKTVKASILKALITMNEISEREYPYNSFRSRISDLIHKHKVNVRFKERKAKNSFGNPMVYRVHYLWRSELSKAARVYREINTRG
ncbi:MAG TPA: hypothetical protein VL727_29150 [Puia sp.]|jgi:hypothetical protein|nr:hypothetical protein [Puia sp.]